MSSMDNKDIIPCKVIKHANGFIQFHVDEGLELPTEHYDSCDAQKIITSILREEQIDSELQNIISLSFKDAKTIRYKADTVFKCILTCYAEHRPLVLSPDIVWLLICQSISYHINANSEKLRYNLVSFEGIRKIVVLTNKDIMSEDVNWETLLEGFYEGIESNTVQGVAANIRGDFSTTTAVERIASIATLMGSVESYFQYSVRKFICGIPNVTLTGTIEDWEKVIQKSQILKRIGLKTWYSWLQPVLQEFLRSAEGHPNLAFWKNIVVRKRPEEFWLGGCLPNRQQIDGWILALFPIIVSDECTVLRKCNINSGMMPEMLRVGFNYINDQTDGTSTNTSMELWAGFIGVEENEETYALTPKIGWFVRRSDERAESKARLQAQQKRGHVEIYVEQIPTILREIGPINELIVHFENEVSLPNWMDEMEIGSITMYGNIGQQSKKSLKARFKKIHFAK